MRKGDGCRAGGTHEIAAGGFTDQLHTEDLGVEFQRRLGVLDPQHRMVYEHEQDDRQYHPDLVLLLFGLVIAGNRFRRLTEDEGLGS